MTDTQKTIEQFEQGLNPNDLDASKIQAKVLGYGEISTVFQISGLEDLACKRMPLFSHLSEADTYNQNHLNYCRYLEDAGLTLAGSHTRVVECPGKPVTLYIIQDRLPVEEFAHKLIHTESDHSVEEIVRSIILEIRKVWDYNRQNNPGLELALDGQLSNWVRNEDRFIYIDTSTPLFRLDGKEQLDPELFLKSAPSFLRWVIRWLFLQDVMDRYYDLRSVLLDLAGNLYKEQRQDLIPSVLNMINEQLGEENKPIEEKEVEKYYKEDRLIWTLFLSFRQLDRWLQTKLFRRKYEYILPGKIKR